jgi:hypothetical protein
MAIHARATEDIKIRDTEAIILLGSVGEMGAYTTETQVAVTVEMVAVAQDDSMHLLLEL